MDSRKKLDTQQLEQTTGGYVVKDDANKKFWVVGQDGKVIVPAPSEEKAVEYGKNYSVSPKVMTMKEYKDNFGRDLTW